MSNSIIEDVLINDTRKKRKKNGHPFILIIMFLLIIILCGLIYFRFYYKSNDVIDYTNEFFDYLSTNNIKEFLNDSLYTEILKKLETRDYETESTANFSSTIKFKELEDIDISKLLLNLNTTHKISENRSFYDFNIRYLDNLIINTKAIQEHDNLYVTSDEIINMYIGGNKKDFYPILSNILNKNADLNKFENVKNMIKNRIEYSDLDILGYSKIIRNHIKPGDIKKKDNVIIENESETLITTEYELSLSQDKVKLITESFLEKLQKDEKILQKLAGKESFNKLENNIDLNSVTENTILNESSELQNQVVDENNPETIENTNIVEETEDINNSENVDENTVSVIENDSLTSNENTNLENTTNEEASPISNIEYKDSSKDNNTAQSNETEAKSLDESIEIIKNAFTGNNENITIEDLQSSIQSLIDNIDNLKGDGITISIYVYEKNIVKLSINLTQNSTLDLEFNKLSEKENKLKVTYLNDVEKQNGFSVDLNKNKKEAATSFNIIYNNIENKKINKKIRIETKLEGTALSNNLENKILITYTDSNGEIKATINNNINLETDKQVEELNETNSFDLINAEEVYKQSLIEQLKTTIDNVYNDKKEKMRLIDNNTTSSEISSNGNNVSLPSVEERRDELRDILINEISNMMTEANEKGEKFELRNLKDLKIEGYNVSTIINTNLAIITIEGYTFNVDSEFNLSNG